jgi:hypothetical protein
MPLYLRNQPLFPQMKPAVNDWQWPVTPGAIASGTPTANTARLNVLPFAVYTPTTYDRIGYQLVTAQATAALRNGIYGWNNGQPIGAPLILDCGALDLSAGGSSIVNATISLTLSQGLYWIGTWLKDSTTSPTGSVTAAAANGFLSTDPSVVSGLSARALILTSAYPGSMPSTIPAGLIGSAGSNPVVQYRVAA